MLEVYNIANIRDDFAGNFDTCAGSFDRLTSDLVLGTDGCMRISGNFQQYNFGNYNPFALGNTMTGAYYRTNVFGLNSIEKHISQFNCIHFAAISIFMTLVRIGRNLDCLESFVLVLVKIGYKQQNSGVEQSEAVA